MKTDQTQNILEDRLITFASTTVKFCQGLPPEYCNEFLSKQLQRSVLSAVVHYGEVREAESRKDFIHKMKICLKELRESHINLKLLTRIETINSKALVKIVKETDELIAIFVSSIKTARRKLNG